MKLLNLGILLAAAGLALSGAAPARALDSLTGTWTGKLSCKGYAGAVATKSKRDITIDVVDTKDVLLQVRSGATDIGSRVFPEKLEDGTKTDRGKLAGVDCNLSLVSPNGIAFAADAVVKPGSEKGTMKGTLTLIDGKGVIDMCTFSVKRTSVIEPVLTLCQG